MSAAGPNAKPGTLDPTRCGPLAGISVLEFAGKGPAPFAGMMLADMGARVTRIERVDDAGNPSRDLVVRGRRSAAVDLKSTSGVAAIHRLLPGTDVLIEGFRPGVMERLGLGPQDCLSVNDQLVYARMTGWGQHGPLADKAGHDINYIALSGVLGLIGRAGQPPTPPLNLVGDFGGGGCLLAYGVVCALLARSGGAGGQVIDASMVEGSALLATMLFGPPWRDGWAERGHNMIDSGAPFYDAYETADGKWLAVGAIEPEFYGAFVTGLDVATERMYPQMDRAAWPSRKQLVAERIRQQPLDAWLAAFADLDACIAPVVSLDEAVTHPHNQARGSFVHTGGFVQPGPAPRFSVTSPAPPTAAPIIGAHTTDVLSSAGFKPAEIKDLLRRKVAVQAPDRSE